MYNVKGINLLLFGGADGIRTHDLLDAIEARSQLRHGPTGEEKRLKPLYHPGSQAVKLAVRGAFRCGNRKGCREI